MYIIFKRKKMFCIVYKIKNIRVIFVIFIVKNIYEK